MTKKWTDEEIQREAEKITNRRHNLCYADWEIKDSIAALCRRVRDERDDTAIEIIGQHFHCLSDENHRGYGCVAMMQIAIREKG